MIIFEYLERLWWPLGSAIVVGITILCSALGALMIRRTIHPRSLKSHHDVAGFVFANIGVLYAVLVGFIVVNVHSRYVKINETAELEASYLGQLYRDAEVFPESNRTEIRDAIKTYEDSVAHLEWKLMTQGVVSTQTEKALNDVWQSYYRTEPVSFKQTIWYTQSISVLNEMMKVRLSRLVESTGYLGPQMWFLLVLGGVIMIAFTWFFSVESLTSHLLLASVLAALIAFLLFLIYSLDTAFSGTVQIFPDAIERVIHLS